MQDESKLDEAVWQLSEIPDTLWQTICEGKAILFLGAGFSLGTSSVVGEELVTGRGLQYRLGAMAGLSEKWCTQHNLMQVGTRVAKYHEDEMLELLLRDFTVHETGQPQRNLVNCPWQRIYTTNYDNVVETAAAEIKHIIRPIVFSDSLSQDKHNICVHINGSVKNLNANTLQSEFKLIARSYRDEEVVRSPWYSFMMDDFRVAHVIIVVGYSMGIYDHAINTLLGTPEMREKLLFVQRTDLDKMDIDDFTDYGHLVMCGMEQFAEHLQARLAAYQQPILSKRTENFLCFEHAYRVVEEQQSLLLDDYVHFYFQGKLKQGFFKKRTTGEYIALVMRHQLNVILNARGSNRIFLVTGALGCGKTIFCAILRHELMAADAHVFLLKGKYDGIENEVREISEAYGRKSCYVVMDDVYRNLDILRMFKLYGTGRITFVLTTRSSLSGRACEGICRALEKTKKQIRLLSLQTLSEEECYVMADILLSQNLLSSRYELASSQTLQLAQYFQKDDNAAIGQILLDVFDKSVVKDHMEELIRTSVEEDDDFRDVLIGLLGSSVWDLGLDSTHIFTLLQFNRVYTLGTKEQEVIAELFIGQTQDHYRPLSSIFAQAVLWKVFSPREIMQAMERLARALNECQSVTGVYESAKKAILSHGNYKPLVSSPDGRVAVNRFYNSLRELTWYKKNQFYWEEFALSYMDQRDYEAAETCLGAAEIKAKAIPGFQPFQIMTIKADCRLSRLLVDADYATECSPIEIIEEAGRFLGMYEEHPQNDKNYIATVSRKCVQVFQRYEESFESTERKRYISCMHDMVRRLKRWIADGWDSRFMLETLQDIESSIHEAGMEASRRRR